MTALKELGHKYKDNCAKNHLFMCKAETKNQVTNKTCDYFG